MGWVRVFGVLAALMGGVIVALGGSLLHFGQYNVGLLLMIIGLGIIITVMALLSFVGKREGLGVIY